MLSKHQPTASLLLLTLLFALLAGCGGGGQTDGGSQDGGSQDGAEKQGQAANNGAAAEQKIAIGTVINAEPDRRTVVLYTAKEIENDKRIVFKVLKEAKITLGDKNVEMADVKKGQQAQIQYTVKNEVNRARSLQLFEAGGGG